MTTNRTQNEWFVGGNGNWFRDMAGARYCVAYIGPAEFETARNGIVFGRRFDKAGEAKAACEHDAGLAEERSL